MTFSSLAPDAGIEHRLRRRRLLRRLAALVLIVVAVVAALRTWHSVAGKKTTAHVATKLVTVITAETTGDTTHVKARLDAPAVDAPSHELEANIPTATWKLTHTLWACYPPNDPAKGELRTPLDPDCVNLITAND